MNLKIILLSVLIANISLFATEMGEKENYYGKQKAVYDINYSGVFIKGQLRYYISRENRENKN